MPHNVMALFVITALTALQVSDRKRTASPDFAQALSEPPTRLADNAIAPRCGAGVTAHAANHLSGPGELRVRGVANPIVRFAASRTWKRSSALTTAAT